MYLASPTHIFLYTIYAAFRDLPAFPGPGRDEFPFTFPYGRGRGPPVGPRGRGRGRGGHTMLTHNVETLNVYF